MTSGTLASPSLNALKIGSMLQASIFIVLEARPWKYGYSPIPLVGRVFPDSSIGGKTEKGREQELA